MLWFGRNKNEKWVDSELVERAIASAEQRTSGEIRVSLAPYFWGNVERAADRTFVRLGMTKTRDRNGVLFFVVPSRHAFVVLGDAGIHERVGQEFWQELAAILAEHFKTHDFTGGLVTAIASAGQQLERHFPRAESADVNELSDAVDG